MSYRSPRRALRPGGIIAEMIKMMPTIQQYAKRMASRTFHDHWVDQGIAERPSS
jgi:hypothetical protein